MAKAKTTASGGRHASVPDVSRNERRRGAAQSQSATASGAFVGDEATTQGKGGPGRQASYDADFVLRAMGGPGGRRRDDDDGEGGRGGGATSENVLQTLKKKGVRVYVVPHDSEDMLRYVRRVVKDATLLRRTTWDYRWRGGCGGGTSSPAPAADKPSCCLYEDPKGRLYNVILEEAEGLADEWSSQRVVFSGLQATMAIVVLSRTFACVGEDYGVGPALIGAVLGLVLSEEIGLTRLNVAIMAQGVPSVAAYILMEYRTTDWPKHLLLGLLSLAGVASFVSPQVQTYVTLIGVASACFVFGANLGARAWRYLRIKPLPSRALCGGGAPGKFLGSVAAYLAASFLGLSVPFLGIKEVQLGGRAALETIILSAFVVAVVFLISDLDGAQRVLVVGSELCSQNVVNIVVGGWWAISLLVSICLYRRIPELKLKPDGVLVQNDCSPVGYCVPHLPDYVIKPAENSKEPSNCPEVCVAMIGAAMAIGVGAVIISLGIIPVSE